jgi:MarR family transcriptional regulator, 2-MHQ and catechol-resistance regulon repressor
MDPAAAVTELESVASLVADDRITSFGLFVEAHRRLQRTFDKSLRDRHGMSGVTFEALLRLARSDGHRMSMSELAEQMVLTSGGVTRLVDRLAEAGYVARLQCPSDRRVQWAQLTSEGGDVLASALRTHLEDLDAHFASEITADELPVVNRVMDRLRTECRGSPRPD